MFRIVALNFLYENETVYSAYLISGVGLLQLTAFVS